MASSVIVTPSQNMAEMTYWWMDIFICLFWPKYFKLAPENLVVEQRLLRASVASESEWVWLLACLLAAACFIHFNQKSQTILIERAPSSPSAPDTEKNRGLLLINYWANSRLLRFPASLFTVKVDWSVSDWVGSLYSTHKTPCFQAS